MFEQVTTSIQSFGHFPEESLSLIFQRLQVLHLKKDDCLVKEGVVCQSFYFINEGSFRHHTVQDNGEEATLKIETRRRF